MAIEIASKMMVLKNARILALNLRAGRPGPFQDDT